jgi:hypothetical protein
MALSPPNASKAGLRARQAANMDTAASVLIQTIVNACTLRIRLRVCGAAISDGEVILPLWGLRRRPGEGSRRRIFDCFPKYSPPAFIQRGATALLCHSSKQVLHRLDLLQL